MQRIHFCLKITVYKRITCITKYTHVLAYLYVREERESRIMVIGRYDVWSRPKHSQTEQSSLRSQRSDWNFKQAISKRLIVPEVPGMLIQLFLLVEVQWCTVESDSSWKKSGLVVLVIHRQGWLSSTWTEKS